MTFTPVAPALEDGVPGLEGVHTLNTPPQYPVFVLNAWMDPATGLTVLPHIRLQGITGLYDKPDSDDPRTNLVNQAGELAFPRQQRGKTIVYTGVAVGRTLSEMRNLLSALRAAVTSGQVTPGPAFWELDISYNPTYDPSGMVFAAYGLPIAFTSDDTLIDPASSPSPWQRGFVLSFRMADPRFWVTSHPVTASEGSMADGATAFLDMPGTAPSEPVFEVFGSGGGEAGIVLTHLELGYTLQVDLLAPLAAGDQLTIDFTKRTVVNAAGDDLTGYINWPASSWWGEAAAGQSLAVGENHITVAGDPWNVTAVPAVW